MTENNGLKNYKIRKKKIIDDVRLIESRITDEDTKKLINEKIEALNKDRFIISVFGHYSNGKSTFLNALMGFGDEILVEDELASTAAITRLKYPENAGWINKAEVKFSNGESKLINLDEIKDYSARNKEFDVEHKIVEVVLYLDSEFLKDGVEIVDTPGFNSTYQVHTEIAEKHVNKSDASIFLFSYDQPGSREEFNFLSKISDKMDRVFLVINKIDKEDPSEGTVDEVIEDIKKKINLVGVNVQNKTIHKISALMERRGIKENSNELKRASRFSKFKNILIDYLSSEDNVKDRLESPLKNIASNLEQYKIRKKNEIECYTTEYDEIQEIIKKKNEKIKDIEKDIKEKKLDIKRTTRECISKTKDSIETKIDESLDNIKQDLKYAKSEFALRYLDFEDMTSHFCYDINSCWKNSKQDLLNNLIDVIERSVDDEDKVESVRTKLIGIIDKTLDVESVNVDEPKLNYEALKEYDRKIEEKKREYEKALEKLYKIKADKKNEEMDKNQLLNIKNEISQLKRHRDNRLSAIGEGNIVRGKKHVESVKSRGGFFGGFVDKLFGEKVVGRDQEYWDDSEVKMKSALRANVESECNLKIDTKQKEAENIIKRLKENAVLDDRIIEAQREADEKRKSVMSDEEQSGRYELENQLINISKNKYIKQIRLAGQELEDTVINHLNNSQDLITKLIEQILTYDIEKIESIKAEINALKSKENMTPEEIDFKLKELSDEIVILNESIIKINGMKEGVI